ncbi:GPW/gp25 family protein [Nocardioides sp. WV_118_6]
MPDHLAFPLAVTRQGLATVEQDSDADLVQSVALLLNTRPGERRSLPDYGLPDPVFGHLAHSDVVAVVGQWEPRADLESLDIAHLTNQIPGQEA